MPTISSFKHVENKHDVYKGKDCMKKFCKSIRENAMNIISFKKKKWSYWYMNSRNHITIQQSAAFVKKIESNMSKIKIY